MGRRRRQPHLAPLEKAIQWPVTVARNGKPFHHLAGVAFGRLTPVALGAPTDRGRTRWICRCSCGGAALVVTGDLIRGHAQSCGCEKRELAAQRGRENRKHGHATKRFGRSPEYISWCAMHQRCSSPKTRSFEHYGGRGIKVCEHWKSFEAFLEDVGPRPSLSHSIDRVEANGNYEPSNCRWATPSEQQTNKRPRAA